MGNRPTTDAGRFRSVPERSPDFAHLSLDGLRAYRRALSEEERSEEHTSELQSPCNLVCRLLLEKKKTKRASFSTPLSLRYQSSSCSYRFSGLKYRTLAYVWHFWRCSCSPLFIYSSANTASSACE